MSTPIEDYALIGDCETAALVSRGGSIDWLCWPRFDSGACFAALLGSAEHGRWLLTAADADARSSWAYRKDTLILETRIETSTGAVRMKTELVLRFDYGRSIPWVTRLSETSLRAIAGPDMVLLHTPVAIHGVDLTSVGEFTVEAGASVPFVLTHAPSHLPPPDAIDPIQSLSATEEFWREWSSRREVDGEWDDAVARSLMTLKALTYAPTGGIVAAPTTSLPECLGGTRNWDYRFCWLRDATLTLLALMNAGYYEEAKAWRDWLLRTGAGAPSQLQVLYGVAGERLLPEVEVAWLPGYQASTPVRIGNAAHSQLQLDVFGEVMDALHQGRRGGLEGRDSDRAFQRAVLEHLCTIWNRPDEGIWEVRGGARQFTYSKVMAWVALDRGIKAAEQDGLGDVESWRVVRQQIHDEVCTQGFNRQRGTFTRSFGSTDLDASLLLLPNVGFLPPDDPRITGTIAAVERELLVDGFVLRYNTEQSEDGLPPGEGAFLACSFWLADAYCLTGRMDDARALFERLLALRTDLGLLAEEYDVAAKRLVGNFPQAFSHVALVNTAHNLARARKPAHQRANS